MKIILMLLFILLGLLIPATPASKNSTGLINDSYSGRKILRRDKKDLYAKLYHKTNLEKQDFFANATERFIKKYSVSTGIRNFKKPNPKTSYYYRCGT